MRLSVSIEVVSARGRHGRRPAMSRKEECSARPPVSRISTGHLVRFVALLTRFTGKVAHQSMARFRWDARSGGGRGANANLGGRTTFEEGARAPSPCDR